MDRSLDIRAAMVDVGEGQRDLVEIGRRGGAAVNSAGSGGSVIGLAADPGQLAALERAYLAADASFLRVE